MWTGLSAPILSGFLGGILYLANKRQVVPTWVAMLYIGLSETLISCYTLVLVTKPAQFFTVTTTVAIPMVIFNVIGMFIFASVVHYSINERKIQQDLKMMELEVESKRNLASIINTIAFPVYVLDEQHRFVLVNDSFCRFVEKPMQEILGKTHRDFYRPDVADRHWQMVETAFSNHASREEEVTMTKPDGQEIMVLSTSSMYHDASGREFMVGIIQDITGRKKMEHDLLASEEWYRILFEHTGTATVIINEDTIIDQANTEFEKMTGYTRAEAVGMMSWTQIVHPDDLAVVKRYHQERRKDPAGVPSGYMVRMINRSGVVKTLHATVAMIPGTKKSIASYVDITEQKRTEEALTQVNKKLNLLSSITRHDIINQLLILKGFLVLVKKKTIDPALADYIDRSEKATLNIERQITFTRDYQDMGVKAPVWQNVKKTVIGAKGALSLGTVTVDVDNPDLEVSADPLLEKVFYNLIDNSLKYGGEGLTAIRISSQVNGNTMVISYEDDGAGISPEDHIHLFERGFGKHTGFGLFLSREMLAITGITIEETGTPGRGARFTITVPQGMFRFIAPDSPAEENDPVHK
ncbi:MAG: PAS domain S-box protein [Methanomicrobiales archaeon]|nr:PAS domain S-box protein [Methanomicrobiales archaeon]